MKITKMALSAALAATCLGGSVFGQAPVQSAADSYGYYANEAAPVVSGAAARKQYASVIPAACACGEAPVSNCDAGCGTLACDSGLGCGNGSCDGGCDACGCAADGPWKLFPSGILGFDVGGWSQVGYHTRRNALFNQHDGNVNLHQQWLYAEKVADGSQGLGLGARIDYVYGVDAQDTQAFGIANNHWDNSWDNGIYGHAIPQLYMEAAYGDLSVKVGHFFTLIGYEVVAATGNFFYSHSYTMYNSEPFTHTGAIAQYNASDALTLYGGYVLGWDSGFEDNGDAFLGGYSFDLSDNINVNNQYVIGRFGADEVGFMGSSIITSTLSDSLTHVLWMDYLDTDGTGRTTERQTFDVNNYLLLSINDNLTWGNRLEWYNIDKGVYNVAAGRSDIYAFTTGFNYAANSNLLFRPELRWDWSKDVLLTDATDPTSTILETGGGRVQTTFGTDMIFTF